MPEYTSKEKCTFYYPSEKVSTEKKTINTVVKLIILASLKPIMSTW